MTIEDWLAKVYATLRRRLGAAKYAARAKHLRDFPVDEIEVELDLALLARVGAILRGSPGHRRTWFARPHRGARADAPQTPIIVALSNRMRRLRAADVGGHCDPSG